MVLRPFTAATDIPVVQDTWEGGLDALRARVKSPENIWDVVIVDPAELAVGCNEGLFEKLDWSAVGGKDHYLPPAVTSDCGLGAFFATTVLAWDKEKFPATPTWVDFWDVAKYPGKRGLRAGVRGNLEIALMADGVAPAEVYKLLATNEGVDRAFRKLDQLKPYIVWWNNEAEATHILGSGDVLMTSAPSGRIAVANRGERRNFGVQWAGGLYEVQNWVVLKGTPNLRTAQQLLYVMGSTAIQVRMLRQTGETGLAKGVNEGLSPDLLAVVASNPANLAQALRSDAGFWNDNITKLRQRFEAWQQGR
ncbi:MAG: extracellular solute-binding protein [Acetobacteraceae bacterium]